MVRNIVFVDVLYLVIQVSKSDVDNFGAISPTYCPSTLITISVDHSPSTVKRIKYRVPLKGMEANINEIVIIRSLSGDTGKNFVFLIGLIQT